MFKKLKKLRLPFLPEKLIETPLEDLIVEAENEAKNYSLILDNDDLTALFKNKFKTNLGAQVPPKEFIAKIIAHIEGNPPQSPEEFAVFVRRTMATFPPPIDIKKKRFGRKD
jgi:hypothetical protein